MFASFNFILTGLIKFKPLNLIQTIISYTFLLYVKKDILMEIYDNIIEQIRRNKLMYFENDFVIAQICVINNKPY